ncbi:RIB43A-like with coiled-coils protein 1 [Notamacropus eugenii]|uniref:RIB43A-like with coiled-coils protein 1 n=1 Tax=Notamacropus eugenii TaxID=9315 RepID=UPI003B67AE26
MYKVDIQPEQKQSVAIEARRNQEKQRQSRIFNVRNRVIGVNVEALNSQVQERKLREDVERARDTALDAKWGQCGAVAQLLEKEECLCARQVAQQVQAFREWEQQPQACQDSDLWKKKFPQAGGPDYHLGPSSMQFFDGEDLGQATRQRLQREQIRCELSCQQEERRQARRDERYSEILDDQKRIEMDLRATHLQGLEAVCRKAMDVAVANYNRAQAIEVGEQRRLARQREQDDNLTEIYNHLTSDMLTEKPISSNPLVSHRAMLERWKGMAPEQIAAIQKEQVAQRLEAQQQRQAEQRLEAAWALQEQLVAQATCQLEHEQQAHVRKLRRDLDACNKQLAQEQRARKDFLDKVVYTNEPTACFHLQFNTSSR